MFVQTKYSSLLTSLLRNAVKLPSLSLILSVVVSLLPSLQAFEFHTDSYFVPSLPCHKNCLLASQETNDLDSRKAERHSDDKQTDHLELVQNDGCMILGAHKHSNGLYQQSFELNRIVHLSIQSKANMNQFFEYTSAFWSKSELGSGHCASLFLSSFVPQQRLALRAHLCDWNSGNPFVATPQTREWVRQVVHKVESYS